MPDRDALNVSGATLIAAERRRQAVDEGYLADHDDNHVHGELLAAADVYLRSARYPGAMSGDSRPEGWPWPEPCRPTTPIRDLIKAGALIAAEIDRRLRSNESTYVEG